MKDMLKSQTDGRRIGILRNDMLAAGEEMQYRRRERFRLNAWGFYGWLFCTRDVFKDINMMHDPDNRNWGGWGLT